ncbi:MAG: aminotransferase class V-fold PLP-dependent enzyme [Acidobacteria bacterium]|nr:MAG: aminotransferase class V-fold PLP-dependent enzyme [Acidobacteriota bacterium]
MTPDAFRQRFPIFERKVFLNSCSKGALSQEVEKGYRDYLDSWRHEGSPWGDWVDKLEEVRGAFAAFIGAAADELAVSYSASTATASLLSALSFDGARNRIAIGDFEFPTIAQNAIVQDRRGAEIVHVRATNDRLPAEAYARGLDERTRLVCVTHVCYRNGYRQDLPRVIESARGVGAYTLVDDYQSSATFPLDVKELGCDFLVTGLLKYMLGSSGLGFLYVRKELIEKLEPLMTGWFGQEKPFDFDIERATYHASARRFETGTPPVPNLYAGLAGIRLAAEVGPAAVSTHVEMLASQLMSEARERGWSLLTPDEPSARGPLVVLESADADGAEAVVGALAARDIVVSARDAGIRVSFHYYNVQEDVDALIKALDEQAELLVR